MTRFVGTKNLRRRKAVERGEPVGWPGGGVAPFLPDERTLSPAEER